MTRKTIKLIHEGKYAAEVPVELIDDETGWSPYLSLEDARKLDAVRRALRDGDVAATMFLRRGVSGDPVLDVHTLELVDGGWHLLGGGSGPGDQATGARPRLAALGKPATSQSGGGTARSRRGWLGLRGHDWVSWAELRIAQEVAVLRVGTRDVPVADHGCAVVIWAQGPPTVTALDASRAVLGTVTIGG